jgi:hypothetical protein
MALVYRPIPFGFLRFSREVTEKVATAYNGLPSTTTAADFHVPVPVRSLWTKIITLARNLWAEKLISPYSTVAPAIPPTGMYRYKLRINIGHKCIDLYPSIKVFLWPVDPQFVAVRYSIWD